MAGVGFGSAGVHIPHACAYPIASLKHAYQPPGYPDDHPFVPHGWSVIVPRPAAFPPPGPPAAPPFVPHGWSVIVPAPPAFRYTFEADPEKHRRAAELIAGR